MNEQEQELRQKIKCEVIAEQEIKKAQDMIDAKSEIKEKFEKLLEDRIKSELRNFALVISLTEAMVGKKYFDSISKYFRDQYDIFPK